MHADANNLKTIGKEALPTHVRMLGMVCTSLLSSAVKGFVFPPVVFIFLIGGASGCIQRTVYARSSHIMDCTEPWYVQLSAWISPNAVFAFLLAHEMEGSCFGKPNMSPGTHFFDDLKHRAQQLKDFSVVDRASLRLWHTARALFHQNTIETWSAFKPHASFLAVLTLVIDMVVLSLTFTLSTLLAAVWVYYVCGLVLLSGLVYKYYYEPLMATFEELRTLNKSVEDALTKHRLCAFLREERASSKDADMHEDERFYEACARAMQVWKGRRLTCSVYFGFNVELSPKRLRMVAQAHALTFVLCMLKVSTALLPETVFTILDTELIEVLANAPVVSSVLRLILSPELVVALRQGAFD